MLCALRCSWGNASFQGRINPGEFTPVFLHHIASICVIPFDAHGLYTMLAHACHDDGTVTNDEFIVAPPRQRRKRFAPWAHVPKAVPARNIGLSEAGIIVLVFVMNAEPEANPCIRSSRLAPCQQPLSMALSSPTLHPSSNFPVACSKSRMEDGHT